MAEPTQVTPEQESQDLAAGRDLAGNPDLQRRLLDLYAQQHAQRRLVFWVVVVFCALMTLSFLYFAWRFVCMTEANVGKTPDWHILFLGTGLILPPTIVLFGLMRRVYQVDDSNGKKESKEDDLPSKDLLSEVGGMVTSVTKMVSTLTEKMSKGS